MQRALERIERTVRSPLDPQTVSHRQAWRWFDHRRDIVESLIGAVAPRVPADGLFVDVGANIGYFSLMLMERIKFRGEAHLFEPVPHLAALCRQTFSGLPYRVTVHELALSDTASTIPLFVAGDGNIGWNTMTAGRAQPNMKRIEVPTATFDSLGLSSPGFIKIDVEGVEHCVLRGMHEMLRAARPRPPILCEIGWPNSHPNWAEELRAFEALKQIGYEPSDLGGRPLDIGGLTETTDVLFLTA